MKSGHGNRKGSAFEREVSRKLSLWLSEGRRDDLMWRSAMSGGLATLQLNKDKINLAQSGDLSAIGSEAYAFCEHTFIECKHYADLQIGRSMLCGSGELLRFWGIAVAEAAKYKKVPLLIARQNRYPIIALADATRPVIWRKHVIALHHWEPPTFVYLFDEAVRVRMRRA